MFPNHIPNPENAKAMEAIQSAVLKNKADLGLIFDTDVDRMSAVLPDGTEVNRDAIIALVAAILAPEYPGSTIITEATLSFLGLGVNAPMPSLGSLASDALNGISSYPYRLVIPALVISLIVLSLNLFGDGLRDAFDPKLDT